MTVQMVIDIGHLSLMTFLKVAGPMLIASMIIGITVSLFQSMTQIQEMSLTFIPKILTVLITAIICLPWLVATITEYTEEMLFVIPASLGM